MTMTVDAAATTDLHLTRIGEHHWLIHDDRYPREDPRCLVAFVSDEHGDVDVVWLSGRGPSGPFASPAAVLRSARMADALS